jgi:L-aminopeptidase/D-esterase-like protein
MSESRSFEQALAELEKVVERLQRPDVPLTAIGALAADVVAEAIVRGVRAAASVPDWPAVRDL